MARAKAMSKKQANEWVRGLKLGLIGFELG
jgi:hypothetical protein